MNAEEQENETLRETDIALKGTMKCVRSISSPHQQQKGQNQLKVGNPADFKNSEDHSFSAFEKNQNDANIDESKTVNGLNDKHDGKEAPIPTLPTKGILKRAKLANTNNEDKKGI